MPSKNYRKITISKDELYKYYIIDNLSTREIGKRFGVCQRTVCNMLVEYNIKKTKEQWVSTRHSKIKHTLFKKGHSVLKEWKEAYRLKMLGLIRHNTPHSEETKEILRQKQIKRLSSGIHTKYKETLPEKLVREELEKNNLEFVSQFPYEKGIADFYLPQYNVIIECDGNYWHNYPLGTEKDLKQTIFLVSKGYNVYRFWEKDIMESAEKCIKQII